MFGTFAITALLATLVGTAYADVGPTVPGPGVVYKVGGTCHIEWTGDTASTTAWKNMAIELMTGDNFHMVHLTTVATGLDGSVTSSFDHPCPDVNPYSAIYFYQFSAPAASGKTWTTRFAIASASGKTTDPPESIQPISNATIPWGTGKLVDPSSAKPPPDFSNTGGDSSTTTTATPTPTPTPTSTSTSTSTSSHSRPTPPHNPQHHHGHARNHHHYRMRRVTAPDVPTTTIVRRALPTANVTSSGSGKDNGAIGLDMKLWKTAVALGTSAVAFLVLL